ncbi:MAG: hypothetical protein WDO68_28340 [Gammaproteobacteria bacterium]
MTETKHGFLAWVGAALLVAPAAVLAQAADSSGCDRECLKGIAASYIGAMVAHDPRKVPLASNFRLVENLKRTTTSEGLWSAASAPAGEYQIYVPDTKAQQVGFIGLIQANGKPTQLGLRLKVENHKVTEAEHVVVYSVRESFLPNLQKPRKAFGVAVPEPFRDSRGRLLYIGASYYDALDRNNGSLAPFADDCVRFENGMQTSRNVAGVDSSTSLMGGAGPGCKAQIDSNLFEYITTIDDRRVWIADEEMGLAFGLSHFRHAMEQKEFRVIGIPGPETRKVDFAPFDLPAAHIFKIWGGQIHEVEALGFMAPYNSPTGWER